MKPTTPQVLCNLTENYTTPINSNHRINFTYRDNWLQNIYTELLTRIEFAQKCKPSCKPSGHTLRKNTKTHS